MLWLLGLNSLVEPGLRKGDSGIKRTRYDCGKFDGVGKCQTMLWVAIALVKTIKHQDQLFFFFYHLIPNLYLLFLNFCHMYSL